MNLQCLDTQALLLINRGTANWLFDNLMPAFSARGYLLFVPYILTVLLRGAKRGKESLHGAVSAVIVASLALYVAQWADDALKVALARVRPCQVIDGLRLLVSCPSSFSMPSGHAITSFAFAVPLFHMTRQFITLAWRFYTLAIASLIAFSRLYLGVHYPSDVLVGALLGTIIGFGLSCLSRLIVDTTRTSD